MLMSPKVTCDLEGFFNTTLSIAYFFAVQFPIEMFDSNGGSSLKKTPGKSNASSLRGKFSFNVMIKYVPLQTRAFLEYQRPKKSIHSSPVIMLRLA